LLRRTFFTLCNQLLPSRSNPLSVYGFIHVFFIYRPPSFFLFACPYKPSEIRCPPSALKAVLPFSPVCVPLFVLPAYISSQPPSTPMRRLCPINNTLLLRRKRYRTPPTHPMFEHLNGCPARIPHFFLVTEPMATFSPGLPGSI